MGVLGDDLWLEAAAFHLKMLPEYLCLHHQSILVLDLLDPSCIDTASRIEALTNRVPMLLELLQHVLLLASGLLNHLLLRLLSQLVFE